MASSFQKSNFKSCFWSAKWKLTARRSEIGRLCDIHSDEMLRKSKKIDSLKARYFPRESSGFDSGFWSEKCVSIESFLLQGLIARIQKNFWKHAKGKKKLTLMKQTLDGYKTIDQNKKLTKFVFSFQNSRDK